MKVQVRAIARPIVVGKSNLVQEASVDGPTMALFPSGEDWSRARQDARMETNGHEDMHAGELETSILLHAHPEVVRPGNETADHASERPYLLTLGHGRVHEVWRDWPSVSGNRGKMPDGS